MLTFDASSIIYAWDNYPIEKFPPLWDWLAGQVAHGTLTTPARAFEETKHKVPECGDWLKAQSVTILALSNEILHEADRIKRLLGISNDKYNPRGVGENDLLIIASAKVSGYQLISDEKKQYELPSSLERYKIPAVCNLATVDVLCMSFLEYIKQADAVFR